MNDITTCEPRNRIESGPREARVNSGEGGCAVEGALAYASPLGAGRPHSSRSRVGETARNPRGSRPFPINAVSVATYENAALNARLTVIRHGARLWFEAAGVCRALDVCQSVLRRLDPDERVALAVPHAGGVRLVTLVSESGLLALCGLFTLCGRDVGKPSEPAFRKWVVYELLPRVQGRVVDVESVSVSVSSGEGVAA